VRFWPASAAFYSAIGASVALPGEGVRLEALAVENRVGKEGRTLHVSAAAVNLTEADVPFPALRLALLDGAGAEMKAWTPEHDAKPLAPGARVPVEFEFSDVPEGGATATLTAVSH
jgi:hypothetical protein